MEVLLGSPEEQAILKAIFNGFRTNPLDSVQNPPQYEIALSKSHFGQRDLARLEEFFESFMAEHGVHDILEQQTLDFDRIYIATNTDEEIGGFHSPVSLGYLHIQDISIFSSCHPSTDSIGMFWDFARASLHDALHRHTFRSYLLTEAPFPHRYQYGLNYRDRSGNSFTAKGIEKIDNRLINLNILMEGTIDILVSNFLSPRVLDQKVECEKSRIVMEDVCHLSKIYHMGKRQSYYYNSVVNPAREFAKCWNIDLIDHVLLPMITGDARPLDAKLTLESGGAVSLGATFRSADFRDANL